MEICRNVYCNISSFVEFQRWWVLRSKNFGQESTYTREKKLPKNVSLSKIGHHFSNEVVQKLTEEKTVFNTK